MLKQILIILYLLLLGYGTVVTLEDDACSCPQITTESDCIQKQECQWTATKSCIKSTTPNPTPNPTPTEPVVVTYCSLVTEITTKCSSTKGCAYLDGKCINFSGCTAYVKTTTADCQAISTQCITDGTQCTSAKLCEEYSTQKECEQNPSLSGIKKCKWENETCKDYVCTEAATDLTTDELCNGWLAGCVTTGKGCVQTLGNCDSYTGDDTTCKGYIGLDGTCQGEANGTKCKPKACSDAEATLNTDAACQAYSKGCITTGKGCRTPPLTSCSNYFGDIITCVGYIGLDGLCIGDQGGTKCRIKKCTDSPTSNNTDALCEKFLTGCVTNGKGCVSSKGLCSTYSGTADISCDGLIGSDGFCKGSVGACSVRICTDAPVTSKTDFACNSYQIGCVTTGKGCVSKLGPCSGYQGTIDTCEGYIGVEGYCKGIGSGNSACQAKICTEASKEINTNEACQAYQIGCVTTGKGCVSELKTCSNYTGTIITCDGYIGTDGKCKGTSDSVSGCTRKICEEAPKTYTTNEACNYYQIGCMTNAAGAGCTKQSGPCVEFEGTIDTCKTYLAIDGKCQGSSIDIKTSCTRKLCSEAPTTMTTDEDCNNYSIGCITNGKGCVNQLKPCFGNNGNNTTCSGLIGSDGFCYGKDATTGACHAKQITDVCLNTLNEAECVGQCSWNGICVGQSKCFDFTTPAICKANKVGTSTTPCFWTGSTCRDLLCTDAPDTNNTDILCNQFLNGCLTNGKGCLSQSAPCNLYYGTQEECSKFTRKCWNTSTAASTARCTERQCSDATSTVSGTDLDCDTFKTGCKTNGTVCIDGKLPCSSYSGKQSKCATFLGDKGTQKCWNSATATDTTPCTIKSCSDNTKSTTDSDCESFLSGCVTNGSGCLSKSLPCSSYNCEQKLCENFSGLNGTQPCWYASATGVGNCIIRECSHAPSTVNSNSACEQFLKGCFYDGKSCKSSSQACSTFEGTYEQCTTFKGQDKQCFKLDKCAERTCQDKKKAENDKECKEYLSTCSYFKGKCIDSGDCITYPGTSFSDCDIYDNSSTPKKCWWQNGFTTCIARTCENASNNSDLTKDKGICESHNNCQFDGLKCVDTKGCSDYQANGDSVEKKQQTCRDMKNSAGEKCWYTNGTDENSPLKCAEKDCSNVPTPTNQTSCDDHAKNCHFNGTACITITDCNKYQYTGTDEVKKKYCEAVVNKSGQNCVWRSGNNCEDKTCDNALNISNQQSCDTYLPNTCVFQVVSTVNKCVSKTCDNISQTPNLVNCSTWLNSCFYNKYSFKCHSKSSCNTFIPDGTTDDSRNKYCSEMKNQAGSGCGHDTNDTKCSERTCSNVYPNDEASCSIWLSTCRWINSTCVNSSPCDQIDVQGTTDTAKKQFCENVKDNSSTPQPCIYHAATSTTKCSSKTCANILTTPTSSENCSGHLSTCTLNYTNPLSCIDKVTSCNGFKGKPSQCRDLIKGNSGSKLCWSNSDITSQTIESCIDRLCSHNTTAETDDECSTFLTGCKTNGKGCVDMNISCSDLSGSPETCLKRQSKVGKLCKAGVSVSGSCKDKSCYDNVTSNTDADCQKFMSNCLTKGNGCISNTEPCSSYTGTRIYCSVFTGSSGTKKCWNTSTATSQTPCIEKKCSDDTFSTKDIDCAKISPTCVTNGNGCIEKGALCGSYTGTQSQCNAFKGLNGTIPCWNINTQFSRTCINKECTHNTTAKTDKECQEFMPQISSQSPINCVTNGNGCVPYPRACASFTGTNAQCSKFTASDGPCKLSKQYDTGSCTPRLCEEAENTNDTDELCKAYHPSCVTNGYGCVTNIQCKDIIVQNACAAKPACRWVNNCRTIEKDCSKLTSQGASVCSNTPVSTGLKKCFWQQNACVAFTCDNLKETYSTHETCNGQYSLCTTKGYGCTQMGACATYLTQTICQAAKTTDPGDTCIWADNKCRTKQCSDQTTGTSDAVCNTFLPGCKTNGQGCIDHIFKCESLITQSACIKDSSNKPCFWANDACYTYEKCEDINLTSHTDCQKFSKQCTSDGVKCIAIRQCGKFTEQVSCVLGTDGNCGWLQASNLCKLFTSCSDVSAGDNYTCQAYQSSCISDGKICIAKEKCSNYKTQIACEYGGTDGKCIYASNVCRLRKCSDANESNAASIKTYSGCSAFEAEEKCTTNGDKCIALGKCSSYTLQEGCVVGTDGLCIWSFPVESENSYQTTKSCRLKVCQDFTFTNSSSCKSVLNTGTGCVSNGNKCIPKSDCSSYTSKEASYGGGTDGICAFTPDYKNSSSGTSKLMTKCSDASLDYLACDAYRDVCNWADNTCSAHNCTSKASGTTCFPVPSFDKKNYKICVPSAQGGGCEEGDGSRLIQSTCYGKSAGTYTWDATTQQCKACFVRLTNSNPEPETKKSNGLILKVVSVVFLAVIS